ncbi:alpha/beta-hydrolase [Aspergillus campestris IBT 28561]|uniref:Feruloyl esterase C n=1 Tax=Aspergillus campestris (strain IBT 28561) TaxID=1392248 RepID=A0A2I1CR08_ASPC2|nr:alpha/beta-hydrolase [Aspergillus campestris IBT 28561]PKY00053.1 alpha/beta-hydrolase [Aspergillus campestris IBT 28561]
MVRSILPTLALGLLTTAYAADSPGCGKEPTLTSGIHNIDDREYILEVPEGYDSSKPYKLIFGLHWRGGNMNNIVDGQSVEPWYGLATRAEGSAIFVAPNGRDAGWANNGGEDIAFIDAIIEQVEADLCVDQSARFSTGFSWGGGMSYALACARASAFRAVSVLSGGVISGCDGGTDPIAYLAIHGINDPVLPFDGGVELANQFAQNNGCQPAEVAQPPPGSGQSARTDYECSERPVSVIAYDGGHDAAPLGVGNPLAPDATWEFFNAE